MLSSNNLNLRNIFGPKEYGLIRSLYWHDQCSANHSIRVFRFLYQLFGHELSGRNLEILLRAGLLHDIGKLFIDKEILNKAEKLTENELNYLKFHPCFSEEILNYCGFPLEAIIAGQHHNNGQTKKPMFVINIKGKAFPLVELIKIVDIYDAISQDRPQ